MVGAAASALALVWARRQGRLRAREAQLRLLVEVNRRLTAGIDLGTVLGAIADASATIFRAEVGVRLVEGNALVLVAASPAARERITRQRLGIGEALAGHVATTGQPINLADTAADPRLIPEHRALVPPAGLATMCVPVRFGSTVLATMAFSRGIGHPFREGELALAMSLADQAAIGIRNARLHEEAAEALREQQQFLRQVIEVDANCIFAKDRQGRFTLVNQAVAEIYGTTVENLIGKTDADFNPNAEQVAWFRRTDREVLLSRTIRIEEDLVDHLFNSSEKRLARILLLLAGFGKKREAEPVLPRVSQEALAEMIGTTRARVSGFMNKFRRLGLIEYNGGLRVHDSLMNVIVHD